MSRLRLDPFVLALLATVGVATLLPASGAVAGGFGVATTIAVGLLFFLYGARLSTQEALEGLRHWRLHAVVLAATFVLFPLLGLALFLLPPS
ncbi:bile acid:sodium symporter, partial [Amycolatopsis mediterranei]